MVVCTYFQQGRCRFGDRCKNEHPNQTLNSGNRFGALSGGGGGGGFVGRGAQNQQPASYGITTTDIKADLTAGKGRPEWIFSCYGPGKDAPKQLFGGTQREQSFEELRLRHYEATAAGNMNQAVQEAQALYAESLQQMDVILNDLDGAVKYVLAGANEHPNRIDITEGKTGPVPPQGPSAFGQPSPFGQAAAANPAPGFGQPSGLGNQGFAKPSAFGQPSTPGQPSAFGQPSGLGQASAFGQPSAMGQPPAMGQASGFGQASALGQGSAFGKPSGLGSGQPAFGTPASTFGQSSFGQPSSLGTSAFGAPAAASPFGQISAANQQTGGGFGQPSGQAAASPFAQVANQQPAAASGFGQPSTTQPNPFGQPAQAASPFGQQPQQSSNPFGQPAATPSPFGAPNQPAAPSAFGQPASGFGQLGQQAPAAAPAPTPVAAAGTGPPAVIKLNSPADLNPIPPLTGQTIRDPMTKRLTAWKGQPVKYIENAPCYLHPQDRQTYVHIFFPDGPPDAASLRDTQGKPEEYTPEVTEQYEFFVKNGYFKDGVIPSAPPKTEWVNFDF
ncbi:CCCH zinc finger domain protein [Aspergillus ellipticus CBS 707.79]|uniref:CCCH zinc finger domain protein n=1 Tax=Aspergillus ellipticus CBS 707.79 TaxID=1448320 RepID=A0A319DSG4_9EURO|nr:CCCH zinc finger domain protein [Aspergillus ellipticus CBS 707.79]